MKTKPLETLQSSIYDWLPMEVWRQLQETLSHNRRRLVAMVYLATLPVPIMVSKWMAKAIESSKWCPAAWLRKLQEENFVTKRVRVSLPSFGFSGVAFEFDRSAHPVLESIASVGGSIRCLHSPFFRMLLTDQGIAQLKVLAEQHEMPLLSLAVDTFQASEKAGEPPVSIARMVTEAGLGRHEEGVGQLAPRVSSPSDAADRLDQPSSRGDWEHESERGSLAEILVMDPELRWWVLRHGVTETFIAAYCAEYGVEPPLVMQSLRHLRWEVLRGRLDSQDALVALAEAFRSFGCYPPPPDYRNHFELRTMVLEAGKARERQARGENAPHDPNGG